MLKVQDLIDSLNGTASPYKIFVPGTSFPLLPEESGITISVMSRFETKEQVIKVMGAIVEYMVS